MCAEIEPWLARLKNGVDAGYWKRDQASENALIIPWASATCGDCRWWRLSICHVHGEYRGRFTHTCRYFDHPQEAEQLARERAWGSKPSWFGGGPWL